MVADIDLHTADVDIGDSVCEEGFSGVDGEFWCFVEVSFSVDGEGPWPDERIFFCTLPASGFDEGDGGEEVLGNIFLFFGFCDALVADIARKFPVKDGVGKGS